MENRFGFRDLILSCLLVAILVSIWLEMKQRDREFTVLQTLSDQSSQHDADLAHIEHSLANGVVAAGGPTDSQQVAGFRDPFDWIKKIEARPDYARGDWLVENLPAHIPKLTQLLNSDIYAQIVQNRIQETLCYRDPFNFDFVPLLATSWKPTDNKKAWQAYVDARLKVPETRDDVLKEGDCPPADKAADRETYVTRRLAEGRRQEDIIHETDCPEAETITFTLRKGVEFSDGVPFTADDVVFSYDFPMNPKVDAPRVRSDLDRVKACVKIDDYTVAFKMREPYFDSLFLVSSLNIMPKHFYEKYSIDDFNKSVGLLMGEGPYKLQDPAKWTPSEKITLVRNDRYWGEPPPFDRIIYTQIEEEAVEATSFKDGEIDYMSNLVPEEYNSLKTDTKLNEHSQHFDYDYPLYGYIFIGWNERRGGKPTVFADKRIRQAMTMLIDRDRICKDIMLGYASPACGPFAPQTPQHDPSVKPYPYDPARAKQVLASLGFSDRNGTGVLSNAQGQELRFKITYNSKQETYHRVMLLIRDGLAKAGVDMELDPQDWPIILKRMDERDFDAISLGWSSVIENDLFQIFHSSQIAGDADNFVSYSSPDLDAAIVAARTELDEKARQPLWQKCERIIADDQPYTFLYNRKELVFADRRIQNMETCKLGMNYTELFVQPIPWYVSSTMRKWTK